MQTLNDKQKENLIGQINAEYTTAKKAQEGKLDKHMKRLKLYNNQKRDEAAVGDPLLFTVINTISASLYDDRLLVSFEPRAMGDEDQAENLTAMAQYDYDVMGYDILRYEWNWDALFFGRSFVHLNEFDPDLKCPTPELLDPLTVLHDNNATSIAGDIKGRGGARYFGWETVMTMHEILKLDDELKGVTDLVPDRDVNGLVEEAREMRSDARGTDYNSMYTTPDLGSNKEYTILNWYTVFEDKIVFVMLGNNRQKIIKYEISSDPRKDKGKGLNVIPVIDRVIFPTSHEWYATSIPDLLEDKQRMRSVLYNLAINISKADLYPTYAYNDNQITNRKNLQFGFNKFIPVEGDPRTAIAPINKANPNLGLIDMLLQSMDAASQRATATTEMQQGVLSTEERTASELSLVAAKADTRYNLYVKVFGWSEKRFWRQWYNLYKKYFANDVDEKVIRLSGVLGRPNKPLVRKDIIGTVDPDIEIESKVVSDNKRIKQLQAMTSLLGMVSKLPDANMRFGIKEMARLYELDEGDITQLIPDTIDEMNAREENKLLDEDELPNIQQYDDHQAHILVHSLAMDNDSTYAHVEAHKEAMRTKKENPELFPNELPENMRGEREDQTMNTEEPLPTKYNLNNMVRTERENIPNQ